MRAVTFLDVTFPLKGGENSAAAIGREKSQVVVARQEFRDAKVPFVIRGCLASRLKFAAAVGDLPALGADGDAIERLTDLIFHPAKDDALGNELHDDIGFGRNRGLRKEGGLAPATEVLLVEEAGFSGNDGELSARQVCKNE